MSIQGVTGSLLTRYGVPLVLLSPHVTAVVLVAYVGKGRFRVPKDAPVLDVDRLQRVALSTEASTQYGTEAAHAGVSGPIEGGTSVPKSGEMAPAAYLVDSDCGPCDAVPFLP